LQREAFYQYFYNICFLLKTWMWVWFWIQYTQSKFSSWNSFT